MRIYGTRAGGWIWVLLLLAVSCGNPFEKLLAPVPLRPTEVTLVDQRTGPLQEASAFDVLNGTAVRVDQTVEWDFLFYLTEEGRAELRPFTAVTGEQSSAGLQRMEVPWEELRVAPREGYVRSEPVPVDEGDVLAAVSRSARGFGALPCRRFAKLRIVAIDVAGGTLTFEHLVNPNCEVRGLVPGETGAEGS